jgi:hypothetical protein
MAPSGKAQIPMAPSDKQKSQIPTARSDKHKSQKFGWWHRTKQSDSGERIEGDMKRRKLKKGKSQIHNFRWRHRKIVNSNSKGQRREGEKEKKGVIDWKGEKEDRGEQGAKGRTKKGKERA